MNKHGWRRLAVATGLVWCSVAAVAAPSASAPSVVKVGQQANVAGLGFAAGTLVTLRITDPAGRISKAATVVGAQGELSHVLIPSKVGRHQVQLLDARNRVLATTVIMAAPN